MKEIIELAGVVLLAFVTGKIAELIARGLSKSEYLHGVIFGVVMTLTEVILFKIMK